LKFKPTAAELFTALAMVYGLQKELSKVTAILGCSSIEKKIP